MPRQATHGSSAYQVASSSELGISIIPMPVAWQSIAMAAAEQKLRVVQARSLAGWFDNACQCAVPGERLSSIRHHNDTKMHG